MNRPLVTIGIPAFRRFEMLQGAARSAIEQTYRPLEIIVSLNPSGTELDTRIENWASSWRDTHPKLVRFHRNEKNLGLTGNFNRIVDLATGKYLAFVADDDRLCPSFVEELIRRVDENTLVAFSDHWIIDENGKRDEIASDRSTRATTRGGLSEGRVSEPEVVAWRNAIPLCASLIRTDQARRLRFKDELNTPEVEFFVRLVREPGHVVFVPQRLTEYRVHAGSESARGLWYERFFARLEHLPVGAAAEKQKRRFLSWVLSEAVSQSILAGDRARAQELRRSPYYWDPAGSQRVRLLQAALVQLPSGFGARLLKTGLRLRARAASIAKSLLRLGK